MNDPSTRTAASPGARLLKPLALLTLVTLLAGSGCSKVTFDRQVTALAFAPERSEVRVLLVYEGLGVFGDKPNDLAEAKKQLVEMFEERKEFWIGPDKPLFRFSLRPPSDKDDPYQQLARQHVVIDRADLFTSPDGRLSGRQVLTVRDAPKFIEGLNDVLTAVMAEHARNNLAKPPEANDVFDPESWRLVEEACGRKHKWVRLEPGRISVTVPASPAACRRFKAEVLGLQGLETVDAAVKKGAMTPAATNGPFSDFARIRARLGDLSAMPWGFEQGSDRFTVSLGYGEGKPIRLEPLPLPLGRPDKLATAFHVFARQLKVPFRDKVEVGTLVDEFLKGHGPP
jgi:hypothetical protein